MYQLGFSRKTKALIYIHTYINIYFEELAYVIVIAAKSKICRAGW